MKCRFILLSICLISSFRQYAQSNFEIDSLKNVINLMENDTSKVLALNRLAFELRVTDPQSTIKLSDLSRQLAENLDYPIGIANANLRQGVGHTYLGNYLEALKWLLKANEGFERIEVISGIAASTNNIGRIYEQINEYDQALIYYEKAAKSFARIGDLKRQGIILNNMGYIFKLKSNYDSALYYSFQSLNIAQSNQEIGNEVYPLYNIGSIFLKKNEKDSADYYLSESLKLARRLKDKYILSLILIEAGELLISTGDLDSARNTIMEAYDLSSQAGLKSEKSIAALHLAQTYEKLNIPDKALQFYIVHKNISDSINNKENTRRITLLEAKYKFKKERLESEIRQEQKLAKANWIRDTSVVGFFVMVFIYYLLYKAQRRKKKANEDLLILNKRINVQKEELKVQSEMLLKSNEEILLINANLENTVGERTKKIKEQNKKLVDYMFYNSHKVRGPLARILGFINLFRRQALNKQELTSMVDQINREALLMDKMVNKMTRTLESETEAME